MPEIPEMELYKKHLEALILGKTITKVHVFREKSLNMNPADFQRRVEQTEVTDVRRRGKFLVFVLSPEGYLLAHMMLDGRLFFLSSSDTMESKPNFKDPEGLREQVPELPGKPSVILEFKDGGLLFFCRLTLGYLHFLDEVGLQKKLSELGPEPLDPAFSERDFMQLLEGKRGMIKPWLMDQKNLAGIGNAYSNEALFIAGVLPDRKVSSLEEQEKKRLFEAIRLVMTESIRRGGDMEEPFTRVDRFTGGFIPFFKVYDRAGQDCMVCGTPIEQAEIGGRKAFFCNTCQH